MLKPLKDHIIVERDEREATEGGIVIPEQFREKIAQGKVLAVGSGKITRTGAIIEPDVKIGDRVFFGKYAGRECEVDKKKYLIMKFTDVIAVEENNGE